MLVYKKKTIYLPHKPSRRGKAAIFNVRALVRTLITRQFMRSKDGQCKTDALNICTYQTYSANRANIYRRQKSIKPQVYRQYWSAYEKASFRTNLAREKKTRGIVQAILHVHYAIWS